MEMHLQKLLDDALLETIRHTDTHSPYFIKKIPALLKKSLKAEALDYIEYVAYRSTSWHFSSNYELKGFLKICSEIKKSIKSSPDLSWNI
jgi:hypothetical protein